MSEVKIEMPSGVRFIINRLCENGYRADIVGGCVRDALIGRACDDYDVTTSATPECTKRIFSDLHVIETGIAHGTVTVVVEGVPYEVTTYRIDGEYTDKRHPDGVSFTERIEEDLARRDFTVNAMAYNDTAGLTDVFGGREDIKRRVIRAVGSPAVRFSEDALRILRALRFAAVLSFEIEEETARAARDCAALLADISAERIFAEWRKLLGGRNAYEVIHEYGDVIRVFLPEIEKTVLPPRTAFEKTGWEARQAALFCASCGDRAEECYRAAMTRLKTDKKTRELGILAIRHRNDELLTRADYLGLLNKIGEDAALLTVKVRSALGIGEDGELATLKALIEGGAPYRVRDLEIGGEDLLSLGIRGTSVGEVLSELIMLVIDGTLSNGREALLRYVKEKYNLK